ncbi:MAG: phosphoheptose isomerase [Candidatus Sumerlaeaceae bacterium]
MNPTDQKALLYRRALAEARGFGLDIDESQSSADKPWGAYIRIAESSLPKFYEAYWTGVDVPQPEPGLKLDPKILLVAPGARLSLQYHHRRGEHWRVLDGPVKVVRGPDNSSLEEILATAGEVIRIPQGKWHRLVGMETWGRIAEIWQHTDPASPSGEDDIVRVEDDYGR